MLRSLYSGVSGMKAQQTKLDVIGNNIANVSTTAFKSSRVTFKDMLSQTIQNASSPVESSAGVESGIGGTNPEQAGLGVSVAGIDTDMSQGSLQPTERSGDIAIQGNGFFVVSPDGKNMSYTRDGSFTLDKDGYLVTSEGLHVMGEMETTSPSATTDTTAPNIDKTKLTAIKISLNDGATTPNSIKSFSIDKDGTIKAIYTDKPVIIGRIGMAVFQNPQGLQKEGSNLYSVTSNSGDPQYNNPSSNGFGETEQGFLEMAKVDLANEFTEMIISSRAFQANSKIITTSDDILQELINLKR